MFPLHVCDNHELFNPLTDQERIFPHNINKISSRQVTSIKKKNQLGDYKLTQYQFLQPNLTRTEWQTVRKIINKGLSVKG